VITYCTLCVYIYSIVIVNQVWHLIDIQNVYKKFCINIMLMFSCVLTLINTSPLIRCKIYVQQRLICLLKEVCGPTYFLEYSSENLRTCFYIIQANILLSPEEFLNVSM
jgi:hypothetical protein